MELWSGVAKIGVLDDFSLHSERSERNEQTLWFTGGYLRETKVCKASVTVPCQQSQCRFRCNIISPSQLKITYQKMGRFHKAELRILSRTTSKGRKGKKRWEWMDG